MFKHDDQIALSKIIGSTLFAAALFFLPHIVAAAGNSAGGLGAIADNLMLPVEIASSFLYSMAIMIGVMCLFSAFVRYMQHRVNPLAHPIGIVVLLTILGILLLLLPLVHKLTESGIPFSLE